MKLGSPALTAGPPWEQGVSERGSSIVLQRTKQRIGVDLIAWAVQKTAAIIATDVVSVRGDGRAVDVFRDASIRILFPMSNVPP